MHADAPVADEEPIGQLAHAAEPRTENEPAAQAMQPEAAENEPAEHALQTEALAAANEPELQLAQALLPVEPE